MWSVWSNENRWLRCYSNVATLHVYQTKYNASATCQLGIVVITKPRKEKIRPMRQMQHQAIINREGQISLTSLNCIVSVHSKCLPNHRKKSYLLSHLVDLKIKRFDLSHPETFWIWLT